MLRLHNSLTRRVEDFVPADPNRVTMYVCGPTVYDTPHLGNARPAVVFDTLHRLLRRRFASVVYARNLTDIDDKIIDRARETGEPIDALTARTAAQYHAATAALGVAPPTHEPRATASIPAILDMVGRLVATGHAYVAEGHVLFELATDPGHGELAGHDAADLRAGHRVAVASYKRAPGDFVLWKPSSDDQPGWESPWGRGRPGWHIECSAMIRSTFEDPTIDIHGGGADLRFPHHEAEISQSRCANHAPLARYWVHNGMLLVGGEKMAKSAGNFTTVDAALASTPGPAVRLALLWAHYAQPLNWTPTLVAEAAMALTTWHEALDGVEGEAEPGDVAERVLSALDGDLNTPLAVSRMHALAREVRAASGGERARLAAGMREAGAVLGLDLADNAGYLRGEAGPEVSALLARREAARAARDWAGADRLRDELAALGVTVRDGKGGTTWTRA